MPRITEEDVLGGRLADRCGEDPRTEGLLYILEFGNGLVKVGRTSNPRGRIGHHVREVRRYTGTRLVRGWVSPPHVGYASTEQSLIARGTQLAAVVEGNEHLFGASFDELEQFAESLEYRAPEPPRRVVRALHLGALSLGELLRSGEPVELVVGERGLRGPARGVLLESAHNPAVSALAVLPLNSPLWAAVRSDFAMYGSPRVKRVAIPMVHATVDVHAPEQVALYEKLWDRMWSSAAVGEEARAMVREALS